MDSIAYGKDIDTKNLYIQYALGFMSCFNQHVMIYIAPYWLF